MRRAGQNRVAKGIAVNVSCHDLAGDRCVFVSREHNVGVGDDGRIVHSRNRDVDGLNGDAAVAVRDGHFERVGAVVVLRTLIGVSAGRSIERHRAVGWALAG